MSDSRGKFDEMKSRLKEAVSGNEGEVDAQTMLANIKDAIGKTANDVDTEALMARAREVVGKAEGKVDTEKLRQWIDDVDKEKMKSWLDEARTMTAGAATAIGVQGDRLAEHAPGAFDKVLGAAKELLGDAIGNEELTREGELERFRGEIKDRFAEAGETGEGEPSGAADKK